MFITVIFYILRLRNNSIAAVQCCSCSIFSYSLSFFVIIFNINFFFSLQFHFMQLLRMTFLCKACSEEMRADWCQTVWVVRLGVGQVSWELCQHWCLVRRGRGCNSPLSAWQQVLQAERLFHTKKRAPCHHWLHRSWSIKECRGPFSFLTPLLR